MSNKNVSITGIKARQKVLDGMNYVADAVKSTLGPFGLNALMEKGRRITNDGFSVSQELTTAIENEFERRGAVVLHEASSKTNDRVGDATTTSIVLAQAIIKEGVRLLPNDKTITSKLTPAGFRKKLTQEKDLVISMLKEMVKPIETEEALIASARVSVEDEELAQMIGSTQFVIGPDGVIIAEEVADTKSTITRTRGIRIDNGFGTALVMNNQEKQTLEVEGVSVILTNHTIDNLAVLKDVLDSLVKMRRFNIAIIARAFSADAIRACMANHANGVMIYPINCPYVNQGEVMRDLSAVLGATYYDTETHQLEDMNVSDVGYAQRINARRYDAIIAGSDDEEIQTKVDARIQKLEDNLKSEVSDFEKKNIQARISQLKNGFAIMKVGAMTEIDRKYKKDKCDDAVNATRLAFQGGTVRGAGLAFKEISESLPEGSILKRPLCSVYEQIMASAPADFEVEEWVRDPYLVLECALENACEVAGIFATTNVVIATKNPPTCTHNNAVATDAE